MLVSTNQMTEEEVIAPQPYQHWEYKPGRYQLIRDRKPILTNLSQHVAEWLCATLNEHLALRDAAEKCLPVLAYFVEDDEPFTEEEANRYENELVEITKLMTEAVKLTKRN